MNQVETSFGCIAVHEYGGGDPVVLLHANPGSHHDFDAVIGRLSERSRVIGVDFPGYGDSPPPSDPAAASAMMFADVAEQVVTALALPPAVIIGNSVGGYAAARLAIYHPERVRALVLVDTGGFTPHNLQTRAFCRFKGSEIVTRRIAGRFARNYLKKRNQDVEAILERTDAGARVKTRVAIDAAVWRSFTHPEHDLRARAAKIACPVLLAWGAFDPVLKLKTDGRTTSRCLPGSRLVEFGTGHMPFAEDPEAFLAVVEPFLEKVASRASQHVASDR